MSPTAIYSTSATSANLAAESVAAVPAKGPTLAIGSLVTAGDRKYQSLIESLERNRLVERQILDRLVDGGECLPSTSS
jgi:anamorsin